jgi:hypothetical protein
MISVSGLFWPWPLLASLSSTSPFAASASFAAWIGGASEDHAGLLCRVQITGAEPATLGIGIDSDDGDGGIGGIGKCAARSVSFPTAAPAANCAILDVPSAFDHSEM